MIRLRSPIFAAILAVLLASTSGYCAFNRTTREAPLPPPPKSSTAHSHPVALLPYPPEESE